MTKLKEIMQWVVIPFTILGALVYSWYTRQTILIEKGRRRDDSEKLEKLDEDIRKADERADVARNDWNDYAARVRSGVRSKVRKGSGSPGQSDSETPREE